MSAQGPSPREPLAEFREGARQGSLVDLTSGNAAEDDPAHGGQWGPERTISADILCEALRATDLHPRAVVLRGARLVGAFNLEAAIVRCPLYLQDCFIESPLVLLGAKTQSISIVGSYLPVFAAGQLEAAGDVDLGQSTLESVLLTNARIEGQVTLGGTELAGSLWPPEYPDAGYAPPVSPLRAAKSKPRRYDPDWRIGFHAEGLKALGGLYCRDGFSCTGEYRLAGARVSGQLSLSGGHVDNGAGRAVFAQGLVVEGNMFCADSFSCEGELDLSGASVEGSLSFKGSKLVNPGGTALRADQLTSHGSVQLGCEIEGATSVEGAHIGGSFELTDTNIVSKAATALDADRCLIEQDVVLGRGSFVGGVSVRNARIVGSLRLGRSHLVGLDRIALAAEGLTVEGGIDTTRGFVAAGGITLAGAHITGDLDLGGATVGARFRAAISADQVSVGKSVYLNQGFAAVRQVSLVGTQIAGSLVISDARLSNPNGVALLADRCEVGNGLTLGGNLRIKGETRLLGATVRSQMRTRDAAFLNKAGDALSADRLSAEGNVSFADGTVVSGHLRLCGACVKGQLSFHGSMLHNPGGFALSLDEATVTASTWLRPATAPRGSIDLTSSSLRALYDDPKTWPQSIFLHGCTFEELESRPSTSARTRLAWLERTPRFMPQPYEHLAGYYRSVGREDDARLVGRARLKRRRQDLSPIHKAWDLILEAVVGGGYQPWRALVWLAILVAVGSLLFSTAFLGTFEHAKRPNPPTFNSVIYSLDLVVPIINFHQRDAWFAVGLARWVSVAFILAGWLLTTAAVAAVSGVLKRE